MTTKLDVAFTMSSTHYINIPSEQRLPIGQDMLNAIALDYNKDISDIDIKDILVFLLVAGNKEASEINLKASQY